MSRQNGDSKDQDLLARLNALKQSSINLEDERADRSSCDAPSVRVDTSQTPGTLARDLKSDLFSRFKTLTGHGERLPGETQPESIGSITDNTADESSKSVEELFAELGPSESWTLDKSEHDQIEDLLRTAGEYMPKGTDESDSSLIHSKADEGKARHDTGSEFPGINVEVFKLEPESDANENPDTKPVENTQTTIDKEVDDLVQRALDEVRVDPEGDKIESEEEEESDHHNTLENETSPESTPTGLKFPNLPSNEPTGKEIDANNEQTTADDDDLAARFASLSLPSVPTGIRSTSKSTSTTKSGPGYTDEDIDTWCIICSDDATLKCIGCDGDLYCTNCWLEGHQSEEAGFEERSHKAIQYVKKADKKKQKVRKPRTMMGA